VKVKKKIKENKTKTQKRRVWQRNETEILTNQSSGLATLTADF